MTAKNIAVEKKPTNLPTTQPKCANVALLPVLLEIQAATMLNYIYDAELHILKGSFIFFPTNSIIHQLTYNGVFLFNSF